MKNPWRFESNYTLQMFALIINLGRYKNQMWSSFIITKSGPFFGYNDKRQILWIPFAFIQFVFSFSCINISNCTGEL